MRPKMYPEYPKKEHQLKRGWVELDDQDLKKMKQAELDKQILKCKLQFRDKVKNLFASQDTRQAWQGLQKMGGYQQDKPKANITDPKKFAEELNSFYCRFDKDNFQDLHQELRDTLTNGEITTSISVEETRQCFKKLNKRKASGPDKVPSYILKACADELAFIYHHIFQRTVCEHNIPKLWKTSTIVLVPKKVKPSG